MKPLPLLACLLLLLAVRTPAQVNYSANDFGHVVPYIGFFQYGTNMGYYGPSWDDSSLADIAAGNAAKNVKGVGAKTLRLFLPETFLETWGYDVRLAQFNHYTTLGIIDNVVTLEQPSNAHTDKNTYGGCADTSHLFKGMYAPIWDGGLNGTPVNDTNYFALYVYNTVTRYKSQTKFWEIINEPDLDYGGHGWQDRGNPGNWWQNNPSPCDLGNMKAPVFHYIRLLRIAYEVIKTVDPTAYVAPGGLGYPSFLDAILRNTDNPSDGSVTTDYPLRGGAYFDVLSYHSYPEYSLKTWDNTTGGFVYRRHSDAAAQEFINLKIKMEQVLNAYGYNNTTYPAKQFICTESNISRLSFGGLIGTELAQKNYIIKALVSGQTNQLAQLYVFTLGDAKFDYEATTEFQVMGLYQKLEGIGPLSSGGAYNQQYNAEGIAFKTTADILRDKQYDATRTIALNLPANIGGGAFRDGNGNYTYVLWAKTTVDQSENAAATFSFPQSINLPLHLIQRQWDFSATSANNPIAPTNIVLNGTPVFISENLQVVDLQLDSTRNNPVHAAFNLAVYPNPAQSAATVSFTLRSPDRIILSLIDGNGKMLARLLNGQYFTTGNHTLLITIAGKLAPGTYFLKFETTIASGTRKLVVVR